MSDTIDLRVRLVIREGSNTYRQDIAITDLSDAAKKLLHRVEPRILDADFYRRPMSERAIDVQARTLIEKSGNLNRPEQPLPSELLLPEVNARDRSFEVCAYGHPRNTETYVKWLDGCARILEAKLAERISKRNSIFSRADRLINGRLDDLIRSEPSVYLRSKGDDWAIDFSRFRLSRDPYQREDLMARLVSRVKTAECSSLREYIAQHVPGGRDFVARADAEMRPSFAMAM